MVFQARDPRVQAYLQGSSKGGAQIMFLQYGSHKKLPFSPQPPLGHRHKDLKHQYWETQPASPQHFQAVLTSSHQCGANTPPLWWGHISQHGNPKLVLHPSRTSRPDPAGFFQLPRILMTLDWYKLLVLGFKQCNNQTPSKR